MFQVPETFHLPEGPALPSCDGKVLSLRKWGQQGQGVRQFLKVRDKRTLGATGFNFLIVRVGNCSPERERMYLRVYRSPAMALSLGPSLRAWPFLYAPHVLHLHPPMLFRAQLQLSLR